MSEVDQKVAAVRAAIAAGDLDRASSEAAELRTAHPHELRGHLVWAELVKAQGKPAEALEYTRKLLEEWPENPWLLKRVIDGFMTSGRVADAMKLYRFQVKRSSLSEADKTRIARRVAAANRSNPEATDILENRLPFAADDPGLLRELASSLQATGRIQEAAEMFRRSAANEPLPAWAAYIFVSGLFQLRREPVRLPIADGEIVQVLEDGLRRFPEEPLFIRILHRLSLPLPEWERLFGILRNSLGAKTPKGFAAFELAKVYLRAGDRAGARALLCDLDPGSRWETLSQPLADVLDTIPETIWQKSRLRDDPSAEVQVVPHPQATCTIVVFATVNGDFMMLPLAMVDALLVDVPANIIYIRDTVYGSALGGLFTLGPDIDATLTHLSTLIDEFGQQRIATVGASLAGLSAIRYGARLGAERAVTFGAMTSFDPQNERTPRRSRDQMRDAKRRASAIDQKRFADIEALLANTPKLRVDFFVGARCEFDTDQARRLQTLPQVNIHPQADVEHHYVALTLVKNGTFAAAVAGRPNEELESETMDPVEDKPLPVRSEVSAWVVNYVTAALDISEGQFSPDTRFDESGLDSAELVIMAGILEEQFGIEVAPEIFFQKPTTNGAIDSLVDAGIVKQG